MARRAKITPKLKKFVESYLELGNQGRAWIEAGHKVDPATARVNACRALKKPEVKEYLEKLQDDLSEASAWNRALLVDHLGGIAANANSEDKDKIAALREIGRMIGAYEPEKIEVSADEFTEMMMRIRSGRPAEEKKPKRKPRKASQH